MWNLFKRLFSRKASQTNRLITYGTGNAIWTEQDYEKYADESYLKNVIAFRCIVEIAAGIAMVPWAHYQILEDGTREEITTGPIVNLLKRPNPQDSFNFLMLKLCSFFLIAGNGFLEKIGPISGPNKGMPKELYVLRPDRMEIIPGTGNKLVAAYEYVVNGQRTRWEVDGLDGKSDILHIKSFNPTDDWWGAAITQSIAREIDSSNEMVEWNKKILENEGRPGMIVTIVGSMGDKMFEALERKLRENYSGSKDAGRNLLLTGEKGTEAKPYGWNPKDIDYIDGGREIARRICHGYRVPPQVIGIPGEAKYKNYEEARLHFWEDTEIYYLNFFRDEINNWLFGIEESQIIDYSLDDIPALAPRRQLQWERAQNSDFLLINEKRELVGYDRIEGGDVLYIPASMIPLGSDTMETIEEEVNEEEQETEDEETRTREELLADGYTEEEIDQMLGDEQ